MPPDSDFLAACFRDHRDDRVPVWFMRQAGRSLPEYRKLREGVGMLESCMRPDLVAEITLQPVRRYGVDAAILYSDIMVPLKATGVDLDIVPGTGPVIAAPVRTAADLDQLRPVTADDVPYVAEAVRSLVAELGATPLIGFAGAPFTLASYLVEGGPSQDYARTKALMFGEPGSVGPAVRPAGRHLGELPGAPGGRGRERGAAVRLVGGQLGGRGLPHARAAALGGGPGSDRAVRLRDRCRGSTSAWVRASCSALMGAAGADVVGVDWRLPLAEASRRVGPGYAVQGNLDPALLGAPWPVVAERTRAVLRSGGAAPGHVFNLGHGVPPDTDPDVLARIVDLVHREGAELRATGRAEELATDGGR